LYVRPQVIMLADVLDEIEHVVEHAMTLRAQLPPIRWIETATAMRLRLVFHLGGLIFHDVIVGPSLATDACAKRLHAGAGVLSASEHAPRPPRVRKAFTIGKEGG
jgi:hypothetical protein